MAFGLTLKKAAAAALAPALFATAAFFANPAQANDGPALWKLSDEDSNIYLFGTIHILKPDTKWRTDKINTAFNSSKTVYFEAPDNMSAQEQQTFAMPYMLNPQGVTLSSQLDDKAKNAMYSAMQSIGIPKEAAANFEPFRPWATGLSLGVLQIMQNGYNPESGVEKVLTVDAKQQGKTLAYFETPEYQMNVLSGASKEEELKFFTYGLEHFDETSETLDSMVATWSTGKDVELAKILNSGLEFVPNFKKALLDTRNANWAEKIDELMKGSGDIFIAVGAGHLAGKNSVQELLEAKGYKVVRQ